MGKKKSELLLLRLVSGLIIFYAAWILAGQIKHVLLISSEVMALFSALMWAGIVWNLIIYGALFVLGFVLLWKKEWARKGLIILLATDFFKQFIVGLWSPMGGLFVVLLLVLALLYGLFLWLLTREKVKMCCK